MIRPLPRFLSAYALHPDTREPVEPPAAQEGFTVLPYQVDGWKAGYKWALVPTSMSAKEARRYFNGGATQELLGIGWEIFDPVDDRAADWELQRMKNALFRQVGMPGRWVLTGDTRTFRELVEVLRELGFVADYVHTRWTLEGSIYRLHFQVRPDGSVWTKTDEDVSNNTPSQYAWVAADERHPR